MLKIYTNFQSALLVNKVKGKFKKKTSKIHGYITPLWLIGGAIAQLVRPLTVTPDVPGSIMGNTLGIFQKHFQCFPPNLRFTGTKPR
jgi:hypothetical protein